MPFYYWTYDQQNFTRAITMQCNGQNTKSRNCIIIRRRCDWLIKTIKEINYRNCIFKQQIINTDCYCFRKPITVYLHTWYKNFLCGTIEEGVVLIFYKTTMQDHIIFAETALSSVLLYLFLIDAREKRLFLHCN